MANMPGMNVMATSTTSTSSTMTQMVMATAKAMSPAAKVPPAMSPMPAASTTMGGAAMASSIMDNPQAGMATSMATMKDMCAQPGMSQMCQDNTPVVLGTCIGLMILSTSAVLLRLASKRVSTLSFWWDDAMIILSLMVSYTCSALMLVDAKNGVGRHFETVPESSVLLLFKTTVAYGVLYCVCVSLIKISILFFYYHLFGIRKAFKYTCYVVLALVICWTIAIVFSNIFQCIPVEAAWIRPYPHSKCINYDASLLGTAITNVLLDVVILVLPMVPIWSLSLTIRQKVTLTAIFLVGASTCAAAIVRVWAILNIDQTDVTWSYVRPLIWSSVEISIGITCACLPTLQPLIQLCLGRRSTSNRSRKYPINNNNNNNHNNYNNHNTINNKTTVTTRHTKDAPHLSYPLGVHPHGRPQMVGVKRSTMTTDMTNFYALEEPSGCNNNKINNNNNNRNIIHQIITSAWASKEDLREGAGEGASEGMSTRSDDNDEVPLNAIRVLSQVRVETRERGGGGGGGGGSGGLSPV